MRELSAVNQHVKHARTALALQVSGSCRCFPREYGKCKHLKGKKNAGFDERLKANKSIFFEATTHKNSASW